MTLSFKDYCDYDALGLAELIRSGQVTPSEVIETAIQQIEKHNPQFNAVVYTLYDEARANVERIGSEPGSGVFHGVPFLVKDLLLDLKGHPTTGSSEFFRNHRAEQDSTLALRYKKAGLIILGKTNTPELGLLGVTESRMRGACCNPWNPELNPGGSSGGAAVAVALRMVPMAHGGDGGGSLRVPGSSCGLFALRPTRGRNPMGPLRTDSWLGMVSEHVLTRSVRDSAAALAATAGPELGSPYCFPPETSSFVDQLATPPKKLRIAFCPLLYTNTIHPDCLEALNQAMKLCQSLGHEVEEAKPEFVATDMVRAYLIIMSAYCAYDLKQSSKIMGKPLKASEFEEITWFLKILGENQSADDVVWALEKHQELARNASKFFAKYDVLATPTMAYPPTPIGLMDLGLLERFALFSARVVPNRVLLRKMVDGLAEVALEKTSNTPFFNQTGLPAMSVPLHWNSQGVPIGIQFGTHWAGEALLLRLARQLEVAQPWADRKPPAVMPLT